MRFMVCCSVSEPLLQANLRDQPLLFGRFAQFCWRVVAKAAVQDRENLRGRLAGCAHDEDVLKAALVLAITLGQSNLNSVCGIGNLLLFLRRPCRGLGSGGMRHRFADSGMT